MILRRLLWALCGACLASCASAPQARSPSGAGAAEKQAPAEVTSPAEARRQLLAALEREREPMPQQKVADAEGRFAGATEAVGRPVLEEAEAFTTVEIPIGTGAEISCFLYRDSIDAGVSLQRIISALGETVTLEALRPVEIAAAGARPALFLELDYTTPTEDGRTAAGQVKLMAAPDDDLPLICLHDELGYRRTFRRVAQGFAASLQPRGEQPRFTELHVFRVNDLPVGFEQRRIWELEQGQTVVENTAVLMMPRSRNALVFQDTSSTQVSDKGQRVTQYSYARARDGQLLVHATLERQQGNTYRARGTHQGKEFSATLTTEDTQGLLSEVAIQRELKRRLLSGETPQLSFQTYAPADAPEAWRTIAYRKAPGGERAVTLVSGTMEARGELDEHGAVERVQMPVGGDATMTMERALAQGTP